MLNLNKNELPDPYEKMVRSNTGSKTRTYATSTCITNSCFFVRDYSYEKNSRCLNCKYCYSKSGAKFKRYVPGNTILNEEDFNHTLYDSPIIISRFIDPYLYQMPIYHSSFVMKRIFEKGGQVILRTCFPTFIDRFDNPRVINNYNIDLIYERAMENKDNFQLQVKFFVTDSIVGKSIKKILCARKPDFIYQLRRLQKYRNAGIDMVAFIDPLIIGINDKEIIEMIPILKDNGFNKIIFKQLFSTSYFKSFLSTVVDKKFSSLLSEECGKYYTYNNEVLLNYMIPILEQCEKYNMVYSFCLNKEANKIIGLKTNCCQFNNPIGYYKFDDNQKINSSTINKNLIKLRELDGK